MPKKTTSTRVANGMPAEYVPAFVRVGIHGKLPGRYTDSGSYSDFITALLRLDQIERSGVTCFLITFGGLHGGAVAERESIACSMTVVGEDRDLFLGELGVSYLSSSIRNAKPTVDGSIVGRGRNVATVAVNFKIRDAGKLACTARATFYTMPLAKL